jgi:hypothetical protein
MHAGTNAITSPLHVMAGLEPAIHAHEDVDPRDKPGMTIEGIC